MVFASDLLSQRSTLRSIHVVANGATLNLLSQVKREPQGCFVGAAWRRAGSRAVRAESGLSEVGLLGTLRGSPPLRSRLSSLEWVCECQESCSLDAQPPRGAVISYLPSLHVASIYVASLYQSIISINHYSLSI